MIYLDSSALVKLVHPEADSDQLVFWLTNERLPMISSALAEVATARRSLGCWSDYGPSHSDVLLTPTPSVTRCVAPSA